MFRYFAYGPVLSKRYLGESSASQGVDPRLFQQGRPALLKGYSLVFDVENRYWGGLVANLKADEHGAVHGVLFEIMPMAKDAVLRMEGVVKGLSQDLDVTVEVEGKAIAAKAFVARPDKRVEAGPASGRLLGYLVEGARERGLPEAWAQELERHREAAAPTVAAPGPSPLRVDVKKT
jgi:hypothetical protein